nr:MAG: RNA-dependent RNA polymerase [Guiyang mito-like virus 19]
MKFKLFEILYPKKDFKDKQWISIKEIRPFIHVVTWITCTQNTPLNKHLFILESRIKRIWEKNGSTFLFKYMKVMFFLLIRFFSNSPITSTPKSGVMVKVDSSTGLPTIFPKDLRLLIQKWNSNKVKSFREIVALLTFIGIHRSLPTINPVKLDTITDGFKGVSKTLAKEHIEWALRDLNFSKLRSGKACLVYSNRAGPNSHNSTWGSEIDAFALLREPKVSYYYFMLALRTKSYMIIIWLIIIMILGSPYFIISQLWSKFPINGRLSVVYNAAGKARVVALTNWWIQCLFKPLHDELFRQLRKLNTDATFDQKGVTEDFVRKHKGLTFYCYDLSAATDRLPIELQSDILTALGYEGSLWSSIISNINWHYRKRKVKYSVGQPMGAYSSWAMLAVTHHVIVRIAAMKAGISNFSSYLVLGDDIMIADSEVAKYYLQIMQVLGVDINLTKSIISKDLIEFAKLYISPGLCDISPIGSGLIVQSMRDKSSLLSLVNEAMKRNLITWYEIIQNIRKSPKVLSPKMSYIVWYSIILSVRSDLDKLLDGVVTKSTSIRQFTYPDGIRIINSSLSRAPKMVTYNLLELLYPSMYLITPVVDCVTDTLYNEIHSAIKRDLKQCYTGLKHILFYSWRVSTLRVGMPDLFDLLLLPIKPGLYVHTTILFESARDCILRLFYYNWHLFVMWYLPHLGYDLELTRYSKLWFYLNLNNIDISVHLYENSIKSRKEADRFFRDLEKTKFSKDLKDYLYKIQKPGQDWNVLVNAFKDYKR